MSIRSESRITISDSVAEVWAYVCDVGRWPEWAPTVRECWVGEGAPLRPGSRVEQRAKGIFGSTRYRAQSVTAVDAPRAVAFAGPMGTSAARWGIELEPIDDRQTDATMWVEVDLEGLMCAIPGRVLNGRIRRVMDREMAAIKAALESATPGGSDSYLRGRRRGASALRRPRSKERGEARDATEIEDPVNQIDRTREHPIETYQEHLIETYRKKAKHYDITSRFYPVPGYPQRTQRLRAVQELGLRPGDSVVDIACGTGLNFSLIEQVIGPHGRIVGVDLTDAMLAQAQHRIEANGWSNISLVQADAAEFNFPTEVDAILSTYALSQVPRCGDVIAHGAAALSPGGRWVVLDLEVPDNAPRWLAQLGIELVRPFASIDEWIVRRPWETIREALQDRLVDLSWSELFFGTAFLAAGSRGSRTVDEPQRERWLPDEEGAPRRVACWTLGPHRAEVLGRPAGRSGPRGGPGRPSPSGDRQAWSHRRPSSSEIA